HGQKLNPLESAVQKEQSTASLGKIGAFKYAPSLNLMDQTISGKVTDAKSGEGLPGVNVLAKGTTTGTVTDVEGNYRLTVNDDITTLVFSSIGYTTVEVPINGRTVIDMALEEDIQSLEEIVVVGYGTMRKSDVTGSVASVTPDELVDRPVINLGQALQSKVSGVQVIKQGAAYPGSNPKIRIRGTNSINSN